MENKIKIFENEEFGSMRTLEKGDKVFFCGKDAATALGYRDTVNALKAHCKKDGVVIHHLIDISLVLAVSNQALTQKSASSRVTQSENLRYTFRCWLIRIGLNGQEFKNCRKHLLSHLEGNIAWLHPEDAIKQRERLKAERIATREQRVEPVRDVQPINNNVPDETFEPTVSEYDEDLEQEETFEMSM